MRGVGKVAVIARCLGGVKAPPYRTEGKRGIGANSVRPCDLAAIEKSRGRAMLAPTGTTWLCVGGGVPDAPLVPRKRSNP